MFMYGLVIMRLELSLYLSQFEELRHVRVTVYSMTRVLLQYYYSTIFSVLVGPISGCHFNGDIF